MCVEKPMYHGQPLPPECPATIAHLTTHLLAADEAIQTRDPDQARHDIGIALGILEALRKA